MRLTELNPEIENHDEYEHLAFDCPVCKTHRIEVPLPPHPKAWQKRGDTFEDVTLSPSIAHENHDADDHYETGKPIRICTSHFFIRNGEIQFA